MNMEALPPYHRHFRFEPGLLDREQVRCLACSHNPGPESALELPPSSALSSARVFKHYPKIETLENRTS
jgi:hypothetical protein